MVYKASKGGVRSGNTLRGLQSLRTKRYSRHACLIGSSSLNHKDVTTLLESKTEDKLITETLKSTGVILSLNKKQRWRLPADVSQMVESGNFSQEKTTVSVLERHKLKRRANCVSFACNKGRVKHITPKQKRYFVFNLDENEDKSRREVRRERAKEMEEFRSNILKPNTKNDEILHPRLAEILDKEPTVNKHKVKTHKKNEKDIPSFSTFTTEGQKPTQSNKPEYRLEVFYPCPSSCSLAFNPKYTDVVLEQNNEGDMEVRANHKANNKSRKHHRRRFTFKDSDFLNSDMIDEDVHEMWRYEMEGNVSESERAEGINRFLDDSSSSLEASVFTAISEEHYLSESTLISLISRAEQAKKRMWKGYTSS